MWSDTKLTKFLSTTSSPDARTQVIRRVSGRQEVVPQPGSANLYARHYGAVDSFDQSMAAFKFGRSSKKSWKFLFYWLVNAAIVNSYIIYQAASTRQVDVKKYGPFEYRLELAKALIGDFSCRKRQSAAKDRLDPAPRSRHELVTLSKKGSTRLCTAHRRFMPNGKPQKRTQFGCPACNTPLCVDCFHLHHDQPPN